MIRRFMADLAAGTLIGTTVVFGAAWLGTAIARADGDTVTVELPRCAEEDGSDVIDGFCAWIDPDTGDVYINPTPEDRG